MDHRKDQPSLDLIPENDALLQYFGSTLQVVTQYSRCQMCGSHLHFTHYTDFAKNLTQETAKCPECGIRVRRVLHQLQ